MREELQIGGEEFHWGFLESQGHPLGWSIQGCEPRATPALGCWRVAEEERGCRSHTQEGVASLRGDSSSQGENWEAVSTGVWWGYNKDQDPWISPEKPHVQGWLPEQPAGPTSTSLFVDEGGWAENGKAEPGSFQEGGPGRRSKG